MHDPNRPRPGLRPGGPMNTGPVNNVPPVVVALFIAIIAIEGIFSLGQAGLAGGAGAVGWRLTALQDYAFSPAFIDYVLATGTLPFEVLKRLVTFPFVHGAFMQAVIAGVMLLAIGKFVGEIMHGAAVAVLFVATSVIGAVIFGVIAPAEEWLYGAYPAVYGFIGAYTYILWIYYRTVGAQQMQAFRLIGVLLGIQLLFAIFFDTGLSWIAELAAFGAGFVLAPLLLPGGLRRLRERVRAR